MGEIEATPQAERVQRLHPAFPDSLRTAVKRARAKPPQTNPPITMSVIQVAVVKGGSGPVKGNLKDIMLKVAIRSTPPLSKSRWGPAAGPRESRHRGALTPRWP